MCDLIRRFLRDESASVVIGPWVFVATILVLGAVTGMVALHRETFDDATDAAAAHVAPADAHPADAR